MKLYTKIWFGHYFNANNVYGINDNFDKFNGHVIPAMISKFIDAKKSNKKSNSLALVSLWSYSCKWFWEAIFCCLKV